MAKRLDKYNIPVLQLQLGDTCYSKTVTYTMKRQLKQQSQAVRLAIRKSETS